MLGSLPSILGPGHMDRVNGDVRLIRDPGQGTLELGGKYVCVIDRDLPAIDPEQDIHDVIRGANIVGSFIVIPKHHGSGRG
jgi:hypothetical protein